MTLTSTAACDFQYVTATNSLLELATYTSPVALGTSCTIRCVKGYVAVSGSDSLVCNTTTGMFPTPTLVCNTTAVECPANAENVVGVGCRCTIGKSGNLTWNYVSGTWSGSCSTASCPAGTISSSSACVCASGYLGSPTWDYNTGSWSYVTR